MLDPNVSALQTLSGRASLSARSQVNRVTSSEFWYVLLGRGRKSHPKVPETVVLTGRGGRNGLLRRLPSESITCIPIY